MRTILVLALMCSFCRALGQLFRLATFVEFMSCLLDYLVLPVSIVPNTATVSYERLIEVNLFVVSDVGLSLRASDTHDAHS
jgi:hypothetical protein